MENAFFMEILIGFRTDESDDYLNAKFIVFEDAKCFVRNMGKEAGDYYALLLERSPRYFIEQLSCELSHEYLHPWLRRNVSEEACANLNKIDGRNGHLLEPRKYCHYCGKLIVEAKGWIGQAACFWHKKCYAKEDKNPLFI